MRKLWFNMGKCLIITYFSRDSSPLFTYKETEKAVKFILIFTIVPRRKVLCRKVEESVHYRISSRIITVMTEESHKTQDLHHCYSDVVKSLLHDECTFTMFLCETRVLAMFRMTYIYIYVYERCILH
jgi:hypothetical protein